MGRDMAIPLAAVIPLVVMTVVLYFVLDWSEGTLGSILLLLFAVASAAGALLAPRERERGR
jgi:hypothetical protein